MLKDMLCFEGLVMRAAAGIKPFLTGRKPRPITKARLEVKHLVLRATMSYPGCTESSMLSLTRFCSMLSPCALILLEVSGNSPAGRTFYQDTLRPTFLPWVSGVLRKVLLIFGPRGLSGR